MIISYPKNYLYSIVTLSYHHSKNINIRYHSKETNRNMNEMKDMLYIYYNDVYKVDLPETHRFPMEKYKLVRKKVQDYVITNHLQNIQFNISPLISKDELITTHCSNYIDRFLTGQLTSLEIRKIGFPWNKNQIGRSLSSVGGTVAAMKSLLETNNMKASCHIAGGTHHAFYDYGEGYCVFSDIAVATNIALLNYPTKVKRVLIIDLDVHQGNGNAKLFENNPNVFTFSMHCKENYFSTKQQSKVDVELEAGCNDEKYLELLDYWLPYLMNTFDPDLIFYQAGVDIYEGDRLGKLKITRIGLQKRNQMVFDIALRYNKKIVVTMGGGYPKDLDKTSSSFQNVIDAHSDVYIQCIQTMI